MLAESIPGGVVGISTWGSNVEKLLLSAGSFFSLPNKLRSKHQPYFVPISANCIEFFTPAFTWSRKLLAGNINGIVSANEKNLQTFIAHFGVPDVIHAYVAHPGGYIAMELSKKYRIPYVLTEEMSPFPLPSLGRPGQLSTWVSLPYKHSLANIAVSKSLKEKMALESIPNLMCIPNFVDEDFFSCQLKKKKAPETFLFVGRLEKQKGVDVLLRAVEILNSPETVNLKFLIGGAGSQEAYLQRIAKKLAVTSRITWLGELSRNEVKEQMEGCDALILPSRHETFGIVAAEAMAMGKPVIATRCGGPEEFITSDVGIVVEPENARQLASAIEEMTLGYGKYNPQKIRDQFLTQFSKRVVLSRIFAVYNEAIKEFSAA